MFASGRCLCGAITFTVANPPVRMAQCHCEQCRRSTGTGHIVQAFFKREDVAIEGKTATYKSIADSGSERTRHFCPNCGSRLFAENSKNPAVIGIAAGAFDDSSWFKPMVNLYASQRPDWDIVDPEIESHAEM
ncbi:GFA family protein [Pelagibacterium halotolerans]|uniref:GFA family protein n=1 Tax=Pelagibacterium halotolerans TaxID=531813 RepID=UPI00384D33C6